MGIKENRGAALQSSLFSRKCFHDVLLLKAHPLVIMHPRSMSTCSLPSTALGTWAIMDKPERRVGADKKHRNDMNSDRAKSYEGRRGEGSGDG